MEPFRGPPATNDSTRVKYSGVTPSDEDQTYWFHELCDPFFVTTESIEGYQALEREPSDITVRDRRSELQYTANWDMVASMRERYSRGDLSHTAAFFGLAPWTMVCPDDFCRNDPNRQNKIDETETSTSNEDDSDDQESSEKQDEQNNSTAAKVVSDEDLPFIVDAAGIPAFLAPGGSVIDSTSSSVPTVTSQIQPRLVEFIPATLPDGRVFNMQIIRDTQAPSVPLTNLPKKDGLKHVIYHGRTILKPVRRIVCATDKLRDVNRDQDFLSSSDEQSSSTTRLDRNDVGQSTIPKACFKTPSTPLDAEKTVKKRDKIHLRVIAPGLAHYYLQTPTGVPASNSREGPCGDELKKLSIGIKCAMKDHTSYLTNWYIPDISDSSSADVVGSPVSHFLNPEHTPDIFLSNELGDLFPSEEHEYIESMRYGDNINDISKVAESSDVKRCPLSPVDTNAHLWLRNTFFHRLKTLEDWVLRVQEGSVKITFCP